MKFAQCEMCRGEAAFQGLNRMGTRKIIVFEGLPEQTALPKKAFTEKKTNPKISAIQKNKIEKGCM